jgi:DNA polymerase-3 subunit delta
MIHLNKKIKNIYFFLGEELYYTNIIIKKIEQVIFNDTKSSFDKNIVSGTNTSVNDIVEYISTYPVQSYYKLIIIKQAEKIHEINKLIPYIKKPIKKTIIILLYEKNYIKIEHEKIYNTLKLQNYIIKFNNFNKNNIINFIKFKTISQEYQISDKTILLIYKYIKNNISQIDKEINKIITYNKLYFKKKITYNLTKKIIYKHIDYNYEDLTKYLIKKNIQKTCNIINNILHKKENHIYLISFIYSIFVNIIKQHISLSQQLIIDNNNLKFIQATKCYSLKECVKILKHLKYSNIDIQHSSNKLYKNNNIKELIYKILNIHEH